jgi:segregation and condensation protein B
MSTDEPLTIERLQQLFLEAERPTIAAIQESLAALAQDYVDRSIELKELANGYCFRVKQSFSLWLARLSQERPVRYSRALLETLALIAYRQPITRGEIEKIRGVAVNSNIIKILQERGWIRIVGQRDVPGKPSLYATTRDFLAHFSLNSLAELPPLAEIREIELSELQVAEQQQLEVEMEG